MLNIISPMLSLKFEMSLGKAAIIALLGLLIVFVVLAVLVGILTLFKFVFSINFKKKESAENAPIDGDIATDEDDEELVAVISAAIACMQQEETANIPFKIKSIRELK